MKKLLSALIVFAALNASAQSTNALVLTTNTIVRVAPVQLTSEQMDAIIQAVQGGGIQADASVCATNLEGIRVVRSGTNTFAVLISLRPK